jgi:UDP-2,3-diacylglucosamine pyrophosphatase LpxH
VLNRFINAILKVFGKEKMSFSKKVKNGVKKAVSWIGDFEQTAAELAIEKKYDYVICGHIHQPQKREIITDKGNVTYLNSGDWVENLTALEYHNNDWTIFQYDEKAFSANAAPVVTMEKRLPKLNVIPEEILLFASKLDIGNAINLSL